MDSREAARYLGISEKMLRRWVRQGLLPAVSPDGSRFDRGVLEHWAQERGLRLRAPSPRAAEQEKDPLVAAIERGAVVSGEGITRASDAIVAAAEALTALAPAVRAQLAEQALDRERMATTGLGHGIATPHPRKPPGDLVEEPHVSVLYLDPPLDWAAVDGELVHTAILLVSPSSAVHVRLLSRLARAVRVPGFVDYLAGRPDREALLDRVAEVVANGGNGR